MYHTILFSLALLALLGPNVLGKAQRLGPQRSTPADRSGITLPTDESAAKELKETNALIEAKDWPNAVKRLQGFLDRAEDVFIPVSRREGGKPVTVLVSLKVEAARLVGGLPKPGRDQYRRAFGPKAEKLLQAARKDNDLKQLALIMVRYFHTDAGQEATELLALGLHNAGHYSTSALVFERLITVVDVKTLTPLTLYKAAESFHRTGDCGSFKKTWQALATQVGKAGLKVGEKVRSLEELRKEIERIVPAGIVLERYDWLK